MSGPELFPIAGRHPAVEAVRRRIPRLAALGRPLLIVGERGTGKTLVARHIHRLSGFSAQLVVLNLAILPDRDQRLALFGGEPPEFSSTYRGSLEEPTTVLVKNVDRTTAYLRECLAAAASAGAFRRPGSCTDRRVRSRLIFTMSRTPRHFFRGCERASATGRFFRRIPLLVLPPLHSRPGDLAELLGELLLRRREIGSALGSRLEDNLHDLVALLDIACPAAAGRALEDRERRVFERMQRAIADGREFSLRAAISALEASMAGRALASAGGCRQAVARRLGMSPRTLERLAGACCRMPASSISPRP